ncbi:ABC transporter ATP-binding protein [Acetobacter okinawensis]|uniref:ABC transporter ATP-binding protein n=1 Tax=Acetobacter okinawensis TaxID=1076594 RepID=UPI001BA61555|nr:ABC transporter ATP-binding protein [Acetobacter okinawensis]MBS0988159.1 ABC transporter ATP-binding protein [Acetobacter okinawensis]
MTFLDVSNVSIDFPLYHSDSRSLKKTILKSTSARFSSDTKNRTSLLALKDISFTLNPNDRLGLVGSNGAGKTTLLRTLSGIYQPRQGEITIDGRITSLLDPNQGMNMDLTGRENILLRSCFLGLNKKETHDFSEDVINFSGLNEFIELPIRSYSSGMVVRLGFAMATAFAPEILLMDEWILAGDAAFLDKARDRVENMVSAAKILVLASHSANILEEWCNRLIWLENGAIKMDGSPAEVFEAYLPPHAFAELKCAKVENPT